MKDWFKYEYGFVNIDDQAIYFTNSGNWSEVKSLKEKSSTSKDPGQWRRIRIYFFLTVVTLVVVFMFLMRLSGEVIGGFLLSLPVGVYYLYKLFKPDLGQKFLVPINKLREIDFDKNNIAIHFLDGENAVQSILITAVEPKGIELLKAITISKS